MNHEAQHDQLQHDRCKMALRGCETECRELSEWKEEVTQTIHDLFLEDIMLPDSCLPIVDKLEELCGLKEPE